MWKIGDAQSGVDELEQHHGRHERDADPDEADPGGELDGGPGGVDPQAGADLLIAWSGTHSADRPAIGGR